LVDRGITKNKTGNVRYTGRGLGETPSVCDEKKEPSGNSVLATGGAGGGDLSVVVKKRTENLSQHQTKKREKKAMWTGPPETLAPKRVKIWGSKKRKWFAPSTRNLKEGEKKTSGVVMLGKKKRGTGHWQSKRGHDAGGPKRSSDKPVYVDKGTKKKSVKEPSEPSINKKKACSAVEKGTGPR